MLYCHTTRVACEFVELIKKIDRRSGKTVEMVPKYLKSKEAAIVKIIPLNPISLEKFSDYPSLGRFIIGDTGQLVAIGIVKDVEKRSVGITGRATASKTGKK
jgi:elongation factor 1-alpha